MSTIETTLTGPSGQAWESAKREKNWFLFGILEADEDGKTGKRPIKASNPAFTSSAEKAATLTLEEAQQYVQHHTERGFDKINDNRREYAESKGRGHRDMVGVALGYLPREGSAMVLIDLDDCVGADGEVSVDWVQQMLDGYGGYREVSPSGTGLRLLMKRVPGHEKFSSSDEPGGFFSR